MNHVLPSSLKGFRRGLLGCFGRWGAEVQGGQECDGLCPFVLAIFRITIQRSKLSRSNVMCNICIVEIRGLVSSVDVGTSTGSPSSLRIVVDAVAGAGVASVVVTLLSIIRVKITPPQNKLCATKRAVPRAIVVVAPTSAAGELSEAPRVLAVAPRPLHTAVICSRPFECRPGGSTAHSPLGEEIASARWCRSPQLCRGVTAENEF